MSIQNYQVNYDINVNTHGVDQLKTFGDSVQKIVQAKLPLDTAVTNIQNMLDGIDKVFRDKNRKRRNFDYSLNIKTKGTEERLNNIVGLLDKIGTRSKNIKLTIAAGKPLSAAQVKKNAKNIVDQNKEISKLVGLDSQTAQKDITKRIGKINSALTHLELGREVNIKTDTAKARLNELLGLLGQVRKATTGGLQFGAAGRGPVNAAKVPFAPTVPGGYNVPKSYMLPQAAQNKLNQRLITNHALQQQKLVHADQNTAAKLRQQTQLMAARQQQQNLQRAQRQQEAEAKRQAAYQQKLLRDQAKMQRQQNTQILRGYMRGASYQEGLYSRTRQGAINRLQYSRPPSMRTMIPFGYMLNGYMLYNTMKREVTEAVDYSNTMESARSILRVADEELGTFETRFGEMARNVRQVGVETKFTAVQVAGAVKYLAMAGQNIDTINKSIRPITDLALIGDNDLETVADLVTNIMAGYDINPNSMSSVADIIASTISRSNVNIIETAESFKMAAGTLRIAGVDFTEAAAAIGLLGNAGMKGTLSGTSLRNIGLRLAAPTKSAEEALARMGVSYKRKVNVYGHDVEKFRPLADIFEDLAKAGATLPDLKAIFGTRGANGAMMLLNSYEQLRTLAAHNRASQGISSELGKVKQETTKGLWYQMTSQLSETFMKGYEIMEPQLQRVLKSFLARFNSDEFSKGLAKLGGALLDLFRLLGNIATWFAENFTWLGPTLFTGMAATKLYKMAGAVTNLGVALGFLGKKSAAMSGLQLLSSLSGVGGLGLRRLNFGDKRALVTAMRGMGITGRGAMTQALATVGVTGGMRSLVGRGAASGVFATQVATGRGLVGASASLGALGGTAIAVAGAFSVLAAGIGLVAYKTWKMREVHRSVIEDLEKKEQYSFPSLDALYNSLNKAYNEAERTKSKLDELTQEKNVFEVTGQPMGALSSRGWQAFVNGIALSGGAYGVKPYTYSDAYQDNVTEALTTLARQEAVATRSYFYGELAKQHTAMEAKVFRDMVPGEYSQDLTDVDRSLYTTATYKGAEYNSYDPETGLGSFIPGLKKTMTVAQGITTGVYKNWINDNLVPELEMRAEEYYNILASQSYAEGTLEKMGFNFGVLEQLGFSRNKDGIWEQAAIGADASTLAKETHLKNSREAHNSLVRVMGRLREHWGGSGPIAEAIMKAAGFPEYLYMNEPDRRDMATWDKPGLTPYGDDDDGGAGGNYSGSGKLSSAAPKQVIVNITNLLSVETIELMKTEGGKHPEIQDLKEQMAQALIDVVHDFDASWHG